MPTVELLFALGFIALNAGFVLAEFALIRVRPARLEILARQGNARAALLQGMVQNLDVYLSAIQMGITMASLGLGWVGEPAVAFLFEGVLARIPLPHAGIMSHGLSFALAFALITFLHILLGELVPRSVSLRRPEAMALLAAYPLWLFTLAFRTPVTILSGSAHLVLRLFRLAPESQTEAQLTEDEVRLLLGLSEEKGPLSLDRLLLFENIFDFAKARVADAMVPKEKVACLSLEWPWKENLAVLRARRFSRYPLCRKGFEDVSGYLHAKDLLLRPVSEGAPDLAALKRELPVVSPDDSLQKLCQALAAKGTPMALVKDDKGLALGIVSLEDILEEIVGEIHDEYDQPTAWSLMSVLVPGGVEVGLEGPDLESVTRRLLERIQAAHPALKEEEALRAIQGREGRFWGPVGHGAAIPHGRLPELDRALMAVGLAAKPLNLQAPDKVPVRLVFLVFTPLSQPLLQLKSLARIASLVSNENLRRRLLRAKTAERLAEILRTADAVLAV